MLIATDLPEPVVPATSRCGMRARSAITGSPPMVLPRHSGSLCFEISKSSAGQQLAQVHGLAGLVGQLDADGVAARDHGDAGRDRAHRARDVVRQGDDARRLGAGRGLELVERDDRAGMDVDDFALDAEIADDFLEPAGRLLEDVLGQRRALRLGGLARGIPAKGNS